MYAMLNTSKGGEEGMTEKEQQKLLNENEKLKKEVEKLKLKNKDLEAQKKTFKNKLSIRSNLVEDLLKTNKTLYYKTLYENIKAENEQLKAKLQEQKDYIAKITNQLAKNSSNSSKPSSTDGYKKTIHSNRVKTGKAQGGQKGHKYHGAKLVENPTKIVKLPKKHKCECGGKIVYNKDKIKKQLIELMTKYYVVEYQGQIGKCNKCGRIYKSTFPKGINNQVNYGNSVKGISLMLSEYGNVPVDKIKELIGILTNTDGPASGSISEWKLNAYEKMKSVRENIKEEILKQPLAHNDETPFKENGKQKYAIGTFTEGLSAIECNGGREKEAFEKMNILPRYGGILMGDHYAVNESFKGQNAYCNAHTIRTAKGVLDLRKESTAKEYIEFMYNLKKEVDESPHNCLSSSRYEEVEKEYINLLERWKKEFNNFLKGRKRKYYDDERRLINLLVDYAKEHLLFSKISYVPFTNNLAEQGLRPFKSKMKVISGFRTREYSDGYCCALSIIQTAIKQNLNPCEILGKIISGDKKVFAF